MTKPRKTEEEKAVRTTITLNPKVYKWAMDLMAAEGHNSLSDLIAYLIRREQERRQESQGARNYTPTTAEERRERFELNEKGGEYEVTPKLNSPSKKSKAA